MRKSKWFWYRAFTVVSDSEIRASYPALGQGAHSIALSGGATFSRSVVAVDPIAFAAELLTFPEQPSRVRRVIYDAERQSLYVAASFASSANNKLWRFRYKQGAWTSAEVIAIPELEDVTLTPDGSRLLALTSQSVLELDSANPAGGALKTTMAPADVLSQLIPVTDTTFLSDTKHPVALSSLAMANDGTAIVTTRYRDVGARAYSFFYSPDASTFTQIQPFTSFGMYAETGAGASSPAIASADGSTVLAAAIYNQGDPAEPILQFNASTGKTTRNSPAVRQLWGRPVAMDGTASRIIPYTGPTIVDNDRVYDANYTLLGEIPKASGIIANAIVVNPSGTRAYVLTQNPSPFNTTVYTYDLTASPNGGIFPTAGPEISIASPTAGDINLVLGMITPDGGTVFFVGDGGVSVVPVP